MRYTSITGPDMINGKLAMDIDWKDSSIGNAPHVHHCEESSKREHYYCQFLQYEKEDTERAPICKATFSCPACHNPNVLAIHQDVNATIWCPAGHMTHLGDGVSVALNGF